MSKHPLALAANARNDPASRRYFVRFVPHPNLAGRKCWQHPCGVPSTRSGRDPRTYYQVTPATDIAMNDAPAAIAKEYKIIALRECPLPESLAFCDTPERAAEYWRLHVRTNPYFNPECECFVILLLNTRRRVKGHQLLTIGTMDTILVHPREVFRAAVIASAAAVVLMHNHPSGEATPSEADIRVTRDLIRAGQLMKIEVLEHVIMGRPYQSGRVWLHVPIRRTRHETK